MLNLADPTLLRADAFIDGAASGALLPRTSASRSPIRPAARCSPRPGGPVGGRRQPRHRGGVTRLAGLARAHGQGAGGAADRLAQSDDGQPGGSRPPDDRRTGQAAGRKPAARSPMARASSSGSPRRPSEVYGDVIPTFKAGSRILATKAAIGVVGAITPMELPQRHDHPQGRPGAGRRLHLRDQAGARNPAFGPGRGPNLGGAGRHPGGGFQRGSVHPIPGGGGEALTQHPLVAKFSFHRLHGGRQEADGPVRHDG